MKSTTARNLIAVGLGLVGAILIAAHFIKGYNSLETGGWLIFAAWIFMGPC